MATSELEPPPSPTTPRSTGSAPGALLLSPKTTTAGTTKTTFSSTISSALSGGNDLIDVQMGSPMQQLGVGHGVSVGAAVTDSASAGSGSGSAQKRKTALGSPTILLPGLRESQSVPILQLAPPAKRAKTHSPALMPGATVVTGTTVTSVATASTSAPGTSATTIAAPATHAIKSSLPFIHSDRAQHISTTATSSAVPPAAARSNTNIPPAAIHHTTPPPSATVEGSQENTPPLQSTSANVLNPARGFKLSPHLAIATANVSPLSPLRSPMRSPVLPPTSPIHRTTVSSLMPPPAPSPTPVKTVTSLPSSARASPRLGPVASPSGSNPGALARRRKRPPSLQIPNTKMEHVAKKFDFASPAITMSEEEGLASPACVCASRIDLNELALAEVQVEGPTYAVASKRGRRRNMEDSFRCLHNINGVSYFGVFDGHGGRRAADFTANNLHRHVVTGEGCLESIKENPEQHLHKAFKKLDTEFLAKAQEENLRDGTTALTALLRDEHLWVANLGDSRAILVRNGEAIVLTTDQRPGREDEKARIEAAGGCVIGFNGCSRVQGQLGVSRAIGDRDYKQWVIPDPEITYTQLQAEDDFLVLASDGLWDTMSNSEVAELTMEFCQCDEACNALVEQALERGSNDNVTVVVVDLKHYLNAEST
eukprot:GFYU01001176.1.p1 GENE.GFYU01001176.1~~GFYU01001176.1.p1  ORF type:complete len:654 (-),score=153.94 GFYU01001176.1:346-2307(-)